MSLIEGVGDEVTLILGLLTIILVLLIAWLSTHTRDLQFFSVIVVELSQRASRRRQQQEQTPQTGAPETEDAVSPTGEPPASDSSASQVSDVSVVETVGTSQRCHPELIKVDNLSLSQDTQVIPDLSDTLATTSSENATKEDQEARNSTHEKEDKKPSSEGSSLTKLDEFSTASFTEGQEGTASHAEPSTVTEDSSPSTDSDAAGVRKSNVPSAKISSSSTEAGNAARSSTIGSDTVNIQGGQNVDDHEGQIRIRLKYLNDTQRLVYSSPNDTIGQFRRAHFSSELDANKLVRLIFNGQDMRNDTNTLQGYNITDNSVIHCLVTQNIQGSPRSQFDNGETDVQLGSFMLPLFALILAVMWYLRITQRQYFNAVSTLSLAGVTFLFLIGCASAWSGGRAAQDHQHVD